MSPGPKQFFGQYPGHDPGPAADVFGQRIPC